MPHCSTIVFIAELFYKSLTSRKRICQGTPDPKSALKERGILACAPCVQAARIARAARESGAMHPALFSGSVAQLRFACLPLAASERSETEPPENRVLCTPFSGSVTQLRFACLPLAAFLDRAFQLRYRSLKACRTCRTSRTCRTAAFLQSPALLQSAKFATGGTR